MRSEKLLAKLWHYTSKWTRTEHELLIYLQQFVSARRAQNLIHIAIANEWVRKFPDGNCVANWEKHQEAHRGG